MNRNPKGEIIGVLIGVRWRRWRCLPWPPALALDLLLTTRTSYPAPVLGLRCRRPVRLSPSSPPKSKNRGRDSYPPV